MPIAENHVFEQFFASARVVGSQRPDEPCELITLPGRDPLWLAYRPEPLQLDSALKTVGQQLARIGAPVSRSVALSVVALIAATKGADGHVEHANRVLAERRAGDLLFNYVRIPPSDDQPLLRSAIDIRADYGAVQVGPFDPTTLEYWGARGRSGWPIAPRDLRGQPTVGGRVREVPIIDIDRLPGYTRAARSGDDLAYGLVDAYFQAVTDALLDRVWSDHASRMSLAEAAGIAALSRQSVEQWSLKVHLVTWAPHRESSAGCWAIFRHPHITVNTPPGHIWREARQWLLGEFGVDSLAGHRPIDVVAQTFASLMQDARTHLGERREREAFLYFVIALDSLLGEDGQNVATVVNRTAVLTHQARSKTFSEELKSLRRLYDIRSRLVHDGETVTRDDIREADDLSRLVLWSVTRVVAAGGFSTRADWVKAIDSVASLLQGDPSVVTPSRLTSVGAASSFKAGPPPPSLRNLTAEGLASL
jgi:hypothetical protein